MRLDNVRDFSHHIEHNSQSSQVYPRSLTNHVTFQAQRNTGIHSRRLERKLVQQMKLGEGRLIKLETRIQQYEDRFRNMEDDLMKKYRELSETQNHYIEAQKTRISELERQGTAHMDELSRACQLNRDLSATIHCQDMTIYDLEKRLDEGARNYAAIATLFHDGSLHEFLNLDSKGLSYATQENFFTGFFASNHDTGCATEVANSAALPETYHGSQYISDVEPMAIKESASSKSQMAAWQKT